MKEKRIALIVDDDPANREEIAAYLKIMGHSFEEAASVESAKQKLEQQDFDYVVLDMCIPIEDREPYVDVKFGLSLLQHVLSEFEKSIPVLVVSGVAKNPVDIVEIMKLRSEGALVSYVIKPFNSDHNADILKEIRGLLEDKAKSGGVHKAEKTKLAKKPKADGTDRIDIGCCETSQHLWEIKVNGKTVAIGQRALNVFIIFGRAQQNWSGKKSERHLASLVLEDMKITSKELTSSDLTSLFHKMKRKLWPHLRCSILDCKKGRYTLGATIVNLDKAEPHFTF